MLSKRLCLICLSSLATVYSAEPESLKLEPLDLERVIIRGESKRSPVKIKRLEPRKLDVQPARLSSDPQLKPKKTRLENTLTVQAGNFNSWNALNAFYIKRPSSSIGTRVNMSGTKGFREGYGKDTFDLGFEWAKNNPSGHDFFIKANVLDRKMDLPEPEHLNFRNHLRRESDFDIDLKFESPLFNQGHLQLFFENEFSSQEDTNKGAFRARLSRLGFLYLKSKWQTAFTIESDKRDRAQSILTRFFIQKSSHIIDENTTLHLGMGFNSFSNKSQALASSGGLTLIDTHKQKNGVSLSPFAQVDHHINQRMALFISFTQVHESTSFVDTYFNKAEISQPDDFIQPSLNTYVETGVRYDLGKNVKTSFSYGFNKFRNRPVLVQDFTVINDKLTTEVFSKGRENNFIAEIESRLFHNLFLTASHHYRSSDWSQPDVHFTPFVSRHTSTASLEFKRKKIRTALNLSSYNRRRTYPSFEYLPSGHQLDLSGQWNFTTQFNAHFQIFNLTNRHNIVTFGYPESSLHFLIGVNLHL